MANTEAPDPRPFPSFSTTHSPLFSPFGSPPPPPDHPCYTPFPSPFCPFDDAPPQRRHAHSDLIQFPINSQSIDSNSVYRAVGCLPMYPLHAYEPALPTLSLPLLFLLLPFRSPFVFFPFRLVSRFKVARALATIEQLGFFFTWNRGTSDRDTTRGEGFYGSIDVRGLNSRASLKTKNCVV